MDNQSPTYQHLLRLGLDPEIIRRIENDRLYTSGEIARLFGCSSVTVWRRIRDGRLLSIEGFVARVAGRELIDYIIREREAKRSAFSSSV